MLQCTENFLNLIDSFSNIPRYQMPAACEQICNALTGVVHDIMGNIWASDDEKLLNYDLVNRAVNSFYFSVAESCIQYMNECGNLEATNTAGEWLLKAEAILDCLQISFRKIPAVRHYSVDAAKNHIEHLQTFAKCKARHIRKKQIAALAEYIQQYEPTFVAPKAKRDWLIF